MFTTLLSLFSRMFGSKPSTQTVQAETLTVQVTTAPYESETMKKIVAALVEKGLAVISHGSPSGQPNCYSHSMRESENCVSSLTETTEIAPLMKPARFETVYSTVTSLLGNKLEEVVAFCEDHGTNRNAVEWNIHKAIVQAAIAYATKLHKGNLLTIKGSFGLVGRIYSPLVIDGNVDIVEGNVAPYLRITGNVKHLGVGPFWGENPVEGQGGFLQILGDLEGYKTSINNLELEIEIRGNVTVKGAFLYRTNIFRKMTICGDLLTEESICPGFYEGQLIVCGKAPHLERYLNTNYKKTSAMENARKNYFNPDFRGGQIFLQERQVLKHSMTQQELDRLKEVYRSLGRSECPWK